MDPDVLKTREYNEYSVAMAAEDAARDIEQGSPKLFYLDIWEVPELIAIDGEAGDLPEATHVSIGTGCTDSIHGGDIPPGYRDAMERALSYGVRYNQAIAGHYGLSLRQEPDLLPSETFEFLGAYDDWPATRITLADIQPLFGGRQVWCSGDGTALVRSVRPGDQGDLIEQIYRLDLEPADAERILLACLSQDFVTLTSAEQSALPDHARPEIVLVNQRGQRHAVENWDPPVPGGNAEADRRFTAVYGELRRLEAVAREQSEPVHAGPYGDPKTWKRLLPE